MRCGQSIPLFCFWMKRRNSSKKRSRNINYSRTDLTDPEHFVFPPSESRLRGRGVAEAGLQSGQDTCISIHNMRANEDYGCCGEFKAKSCFCSVLTGRSDDGGPTNHRQYSSVSFVSFAFTSPWFQCRACILNLKQGRDARNQGNKVLIYFFALHLRPVSRAAYYTTSTFRQNRIIPRPKANYSSSAQTKLIPRPRGYANDTPFIIPHTSHISLPL